MPLAFFSKLRRLRNVNQICFYFFLRSGAVFDFLFSTRSVNQLRFNKQNSQPKSVQDTFIIEDRVFIASQEIVALLGRNLDEEIYNLKSEIIINLKPD